MGRNAYIKSTGLKSKSDKFKEIISVSVIVNFLSFSLQEHFYPLHTPNFHNNLIVVIATNFFYVNLIKTVFC